MDTLEITYCFKTGATDPVEFRLELDSGTLALPRPEGEIPDWAGLTFRQCPNCPLSPEDVPNCPAAAHLSRLVEALNHLVSFDRVRVEVTTAQRVVSKEVSTQQGMGALMGLIMATSGCPITTFFRPMARFHLPFATQDETIFRAASTYLLADFFRVRERGGEMDLALDGLTAIYREVHAMNQAFFQRLKAAARTDASLNALVHLDSFALMLPLQAQHALPALAEYFRPFLEGFPPPGEWEEGHR